MDQPNSSSSPPLRVLIRPSSSSKSINLSSLQPSSLSPRRQQQKASPSTSSPPTDGVVVVGFIGSRPGADVSHLINRILDANVFGSGNIGKVLPVDLERKEEDWFRNRRISYHYVEEKGIVFLQFSSSGLFSSGFGKTRDGIGGFELDLEEQEADDLRGFLFMFLVTPPFPIVVVSCPVIQFEKSCLPASVQDHEHQSQFSLDCQVTLPPESFLALRLPFVYGIQVDDKSLHPLKHLEENP